MSKKPSKRIQIKGDVNINNGDFIAGDKTVSHNDNGKLSVHDNPVINKDELKVKSRDVAEHLDVNGGDVVFGDKIIKFFQENLNIYLFKDLPQLALFLGFLILVSGAIGGGYWYSIQPKRMTGNYNIAVAQFGEIQNNGHIKPSKSATNIHRRIFDFLDGEYKGSSFGINVQVDDKNMPLITTDAQAEELARKLNADIVIYGVISIQQNEADFQPRFYVAEQPDTKEITGTNQLAVPITFAISDLNIEGGLNSQLRARTGILFNFTKALIYFSQKDYDSALQTVDFAISTAEKLPHPFDGEEVLYLLAAKIYIEQKNYAGANQMLDQALVLNSNYARAHLGRGNIYYEQARLSDFDTNLLLKAKAEYQLALNAVDQPEGAYIPIKAYTGLCNVVGVMAQDQDPIEPTLVAEATEYCVHVINEYQRTEDPFLQSYASTSYFSVGAINQAQGKTDQAIDAYRRAYDLAQDQNEKERIKKQLENLQGQ